MRKKQSLCKRKHPLRGANVIHKTDGTRQCRLCKAKADAAHGLRRRARERSSYADDADWKRNNP